MPAFYTVHVQGSHGNGTAIQISSGSNQFSRADRNALVAGSPIGEFSLPTPNRSSTVNADDNAISMTEFPVPTQFGASAPREIALGGDGRMWFGDTAAHNPSVGAVTLSGQITRYWQTDYPWGGLAAGLDKNVWFGSENACCGSDSIGRITPDGTTTRYFPTAYSYPGGVAEGPDGNIWFTEQQLSTIGRISTSGVIKEFSIPSNLPSCCASEVAPAGITSGPDGNMWFTEAGPSAIGRITPSGQITQFPLQPGQAPDISLNVGGIVTGPDGNLWFTESPGHGWGAVGRITPEGKITTFPLPADVGTEPRGIAAGSDGNLWFTAAPNFIDRITTSGTITAFPTPTSNSYPWSIAAGPDANLWFTESGAGMIGRVNLSHGPAPTNCADQVLTGSYTDITVSPGHWCDLEEARVNGTLSAKGASGLGIGEGTFIQGDVLANNVTSVPAESGANKSSVNFICNATIGGKLEIDGSTASAPWNVGGSEGKYGFGACTNSGIYVGHGSDLSNNAAAINIENNDFETYLSCLHDSAITGGMNGVDGPIQGECILHAYPGDVVEPQQSNDGDGNPDTEPALKTCASAGGDGTGQPVTYYNWQLSYEISQCEGLVISDVGLGAYSGGRRMAERMSLPYLDIATCLPTVASGCTHVQSRHISLQVNADETVSQTPPTIYTLVRLVSGPTLNRVTSPSSPPCNGLFLCDHLSVEATYRVFLAPPTPNLTNDEYVDVTQNYEFYRDFNENNLGDKDFKNLGCEPKLPLFGHNLSDCARWKPLVHYDYHPGTSQRVILRVNAAERLHFTPDYLAVRASTLARDCDRGTDQHGCGFTGQLELYPPTSNAGENPIAHEAIIRAITAAPNGAGNIAGRYDNLHLTPAEGVGLPFPPPGCPECIHVHWRWGKDVGGQDPTFGGGLPLVGDAEPGARPTTKSEQQLDVALVAYHSDELSPYNFSDLVQGANVSDLNLSGGAVGQSPFKGGYTAGRETLHYPASSCFSGTNPASWGQCGQVVWLSGTTFASKPGTESSDTFFAFGGFFCTTCENNDGYYDFAPGLHPNYIPPATPPFHVGPDTPLTIELMSELPRENTVVRDLLPAGSHSITVTMALPQTGLGVKPRLFCKVLTLRVGQEVSCFLDLGPDSSYWSKDYPLISCPTGDCIAVHLRTPLRPGSYTNTVSDAWDYNPANDTRHLSGNLKLTDNIIVR